jgi:hypothetical protein
MNFSIIARLVLIPLIIGSCNLLEPDTDNLPDVYGGSSVYHISKNKKRIYAKMGSPLGRVWHQVDTDPKKLIVLNIRFAKDDKNLFDEGYVVSPDYDTSGIPGKIDLESFYVDKQGFPRDKNHVYLKYTYGRHMVVIDGADVNTFDGMDGGSLTRDGKHYFYFETMLNIKDYDSFIFYNTGAPNYGKDKFHIYLIKTDKYGNNLFPAGATIIPNINPQTFEVIEQDERWVKDDKHYYYWGKQSDVDYNSFQMLQQHVAIDKDHVYMDGKIADMTIEYAKEKYGTK